MSSIDLSELLREVSAESPCGPNLEYDPAFHDLEQEAAGTPERRIGDSVIPAEEPAWREVKRRSIELLKRTKDLRVAVHLTRALLETEGLAGLPEGLEFIHKLLDQYWDQVHPQLDSDDGDPTFRVNAMVGLADRDGLVRRLREKPLVSGRLGRFSLRDIEIANGSLPKPADAEATIPEMPVIESAFSEAEAGELQALSLSLQSAIVEVAQITAVVTDKVGAAKSIDLGDLAKVLQSAARIVATHLPQTEEGEPALGGTPAEGGSGQKKPSSGEITSREDVIRFLDKACDFLSKNEPSSPVPLLLQRAKRLVSKDFLEIMEDLAPGGLTEARRIGGLDK